MAERFDEIDCLTAYLAWTRGVSVHAPHMCVWRV